MAGILEVLAEGDSSAKVEGHARADEIGPMARAVQVKDSGLTMRRLEAEAARQKAQAEEQRKADMLALVNEFEASVMGVVEGVSSAATQAQSSAESLSAIADAAARRSTAVAAATERRPQRADRCGGIGRAGRLHLRDQPSGDRLVAHVEDRGGRGGDHQRHGHRACHGGPAHR
ncbi:hypothetical protein [Azospirillum endophyticum]